jgi:uncharacterized protein (TIGR03118 family)
MSGFRYVSNLLRSNYKSTSTRKPVRARLGVEGLEERSLLSASYLQTNLVSDLPGLAQQQDATLINPWGISAAPAAGAFWVSSNGSTVSELYLGDVNGTPLSQLFRVSIPGGTQTGQVFNLNQPIMGTGNTNDFTITDGTNSHPAVFLFANELGWIVAWHPAVGPQTAELGLSTQGQIAFQADDGAVYEGLAMGSVGNANFLYTTDFRNGAIDVIDGQFHKVAAGTNGFGNFQDPNLPAGFAPYGISNINGRLFVSYAKQNAMGTKDIAGAGNGFIDEFTTNGTFIRRLVSGGALNSPWGMVMAPSNFGTFSNDLLVSNFGDGTISAFNPTTGALDGQMQDANGNVLHIDGVRGLIFGNGASSGATNSLFFTAGLNNGRNGLFGSLQATVAGGSNARFIDRLYQTFLNRQAEPAGLAFWMAQLNQGMTRAQVAAGIQNSVEFRTDLVMKAYQQFLHRAPEQGGLNFWVNFLQQGHTVEQMQAGIVGSREYFQSRGGATNNGFLTALYQDALGRAVDISGQTTFTTQLNGGVTTGQEASAVFASNEFQQNLVQADYALFLNRGADATGLGEFTNALRQGQTDQQIAAAIAASDELFAGV